MLNALSLIFDRAGVETLNRGREVRHVNYLKGDISVGLKIGCELELGPYLQEIRHLVLLHGTVYLRCDSKRLANCY